MSPIAAPTTGRVSRTVDSADWEITETPFAAAVRHADGTAFQGVLVLTSSTVLRPVEHFLHFVEFENRSPGMRTRTGRTASARHRRGGDPARQTRRARGWGS